MNQFKPTQYATLLMVLFLLIHITSFAQTDSSHLKIDQDKINRELEAIPESSELDLLMGEEEKQKTIFVRNAFKSSRVINGHSMEMLGAGVLDFRILHRFGQFKDGISELFGLDQASMRMGFDYGISKNLSIGIGRSTFNKELDAFFKWRLIHQRKGFRAFPFSVLINSGITYTTVKPSATVSDYLSNRLSYYQQLIIGSKISNGFTLQFAPTLVHRNLVERATDQNDMIALGIGSRIKLTNRTSLVFDAYPILYGARPNYHKLPLSIGFDIETGGHVFQLHVSNAPGMNEKDFITETLQDWGKGEIQFGFNLSRVFTVKKNRVSSE